MIIDKKHFYDSYREIFGVIKDPVVKALDFLLDKFDASEVFSTKARISYALATIKRETAETFEPVSEGYWIKGDSVGSCPVPSQNAQSLSFISFFVLGFLYFFVFD